MNFCFFVTVEIAENAPANYSAFSSVAIKHLNTAFDQGLGWVEFGQLINTLKHWFHHFNHLFVTCFIFFRELKDFRLILDMGKRLSLLVTLKMNHRLVINIAFLFTTERPLFLNQSLVRIDLETESGTKRKIQIHTTPNLVISRYFVEDGKEMYQEL